MRCTRNSIGWRRAVTGYCGRRRSGGEDGNNPDRSGSVLVGGAMVRRIDQDVIVGDGVAVEEMGQRVAVRVDQREVNIGRPGEVDVLFVLEVIFGLEKHAGFLL